MLADLLSPAVLVTMGVTLAVLFAAWWDERKSKNITSWYKHFDKSRKDDDSDKWTYR